MKETKKKMSFESLRLVAQNVTFKEYAHKLLLAVTAHSQKHVTQTVKGKLENMLLSIAAGIESNPSVDQTDLFVFIYSIIEDGLIKSENKDSCSHLITVFGMRMLHKRIKGKGNYPEEKCIMDMEQCVKDKNTSLKKKRDENTLSLLDPFVKLLSDGLCSKYDDILSSSFGCLTVLVKLPLPSLQVHAERIKSVVLDIAQHPMNSRSPLMQSCLTLLTSLLRNTEISLDQEQIHMLIKLPIFVDLEINPSFTALSLLKGIVNRKLDAAEIYDIVARVAKLMVTSQMESIRKKCSKILLHFLLDYRLSEKRLQQHLNFLLSNLR
jgi:U3 small nucleolar RNA-associated protein 20